MANLCMNHVAYGNQFLVTRMSTNKLSIYLNDEIIKCHINNRFVKWLLYLG